VTLHNRLEPLAGLAYRIVHPLTELLLNVPQLHGCGGNMLRSLRLLVPLALVPVSLFAAGLASDLDVRRRALNDLLNEQWEYTMRHSPIYASILGDKRYNDQLDDYSQQAIDENLRQERQFLTRFQSIDTTVFPEQEVLNKVLMIRDLRMDLEGARFKRWEMPVNQMWGIHINLPQLVNLLAFETVKDYDDYIARLVDASRQKCPRRLTNSGFSAQNPWQSGR
jgi:hypothetical protein